MVSIRIILASSSPRRQQLLKMAGIGEFEIILPSGDEPDTGDLPPDKAVEKLARIKCLEVAKKAEAEAKAKTDISRLIIAADTMVYLGKTLLGKPKDEAEAYDMLKSLSGQKHTVYTGVFIKTGTETKCATEATDVFFRNITDSEIRAYINTGEPMDKAGAYGAQGRGAIFIRKISGDYFNVVGLPLCRLCEMLSEMGVSLL